MPGSWSIRDKINMMSSCAVISVWLVAALLVLAITEMRAQDTRDTSKTELDWSLIPSGQALQAPYAGKIEARVGGSRESANDKLRLDIGAAVDIVRLGQSEQKGSTTSVRSSLNALTLGAEFFTWTRLRANDNFKFPVEAVDYYFGIYGNGGLPFLEPSAGLSYRVRLAHISAHLVDGDPSFTDPQQQYITYSREFADVMLMYEVTQLRSVLSPVHIFRPYIGAVWLFHTIPDTLGVLTPYAGCDFSWQFLQSMPLTLKAGYEVRLNTELEPIGEHHARLGVKLGTPDSRGVVLEGSYYSGRSPYGQHFYRREKFFSVGFAVEF